MDITSFIFGNQNRTIIGANNNLSGGMYGRLKNLLSISPNGKAGIVVDATIRDNPVYNADVTRNPVEDGSKITDHVQPNPIELTIEGEISETPIGYAIVGNFKNLVSSIRELAGKNSRAIDAKEDMLALYYNRIPFTVNTRLKTYDNMVFKSLEFPSDASTGGKIVFVANLTEIVIVSRGTVQPSLDDSVKDIGRKRADKGTKSSDSVDSASKNAKDSNTVSQQTKSKADESSVYKLIFKPKEVLKSATNFFGLK